MQRGEVEVKPFIIPLVECLPNGLSAMRIQVVANLRCTRLARVRSRHALHDGDQIVLGTPLAAVCQHLSGMHIKRGNQRLGAVADIFKLSCARWLEC